MADTVKAPALTSVSGQADLRAAVNRLIEAVSPLVGQHSDKGNEAVRWADLIDGGIATKTIDGNTVQIPSQDSIPALPPTALKNFVASPSFSYVTLSWDATNVKAVAFVEIWRAPRLKEDGSDSVIGDAKLRGVSSSVMYSDTVLPADEFRYWARTVNRKGLYGPWTSVAGTVVIVPQDPGYILDKISGSIMESDLYVDLAEKIESSGTGVKSLQSLTNNSYTVKIDSGNAVAGFGIMTDDTGLSQFIIRVDRFALAAPQTYDQNGQPVVNDASLPFVADMTDPSNPKILMKNAYIDKAFITSLVTGQVIADAVVGQTIQGTHIRGGDIAIGNNFQVDGLGNMTASNAVVSGNITATTLTATGSVSVGAVTGAGVYMTKDRIDVRDAAGVVRCRIGAL